MQHSTGQYDDLARVPRARPREGCRRRTTAPVSKPGDLWVLGSHRLLCGDARNVDHLARLMGGARAAMAFLDAPYDVRVPDTVGRGQAERTEFAMAPGELRR